MKKRSEANRHGAALARLAVKQHADRLKSEYQNILAVSDAVDNLAQHDSHVVAIYLKDEHTTGLPLQLTVEMPDGTVKYVRTELIKGVGVPRIQLAQSESEVAGDAEMTYPGSFCCAVWSSTDDQFRGLVTAVHICTYGNYDVYDGVLNNRDQTDVFIDGMQAGKWVYETLNAKQDLAVVALSNDFGENADLISFQNQFYQIADENVKTDAANVRLVARNGHEADGYIIDYLVGLDVSYLNGDFYKKNIILVSSNSDRGNSQPISQDGDSGGCLYHLETKELIGILLGSTTNFSLVLPINETLQSYNLLTV